MPKFLSPMLMLLACTAGAAEVPVFLDQTKSWDERTADFVSRMTLEQKALALNHRGPTIAVAGFALRADQWNQCLNGVMWNRPTTLFPSCIALGATWDTRLVHEVAGVLSDEARAIYNGWHRDPNFTGERKGLIYRAPVINISRNPYWGRIHEVYSEDTFLTGRMAVAYVSGLQGDDPRYLKLAATLKHYAVNNVEAGRTKLNAVVSERMLREFWLPHFRDAVVEGHAQSLMASYNAINGTPNNINHWLLTEVLKGEWKHEGFVVSDLGGVKTMVNGHAWEKMTYVDAVAQSVMAGCDFSDKEYAENIPAGVAQGKLSQERLDDAVRRVIRVRMRLGEFDPQAGQPWSALEPANIKSPAHLAVARKAAQEAIVLLGNRTGLLPLHAATVTSIAVIGPHADRITKNNYNGVAANSVTALAGLHEQVGAGLTIRTAIGSVMSSKDRPPLKEGAPATPFDAVAELAKAVEAARTSDVAIVCVGTNASVEGEGRDRTSLGLPAEQEALVEAVVAANPRTVVVLMSAGPLTVPWIKDHAAAVLQAWWGGDEGGHALADVLFGEVNPAGRLPYTVYASETQVPAQDEYDVSKGFTYQYLRGEPLWAFGHGLSYTTFSYRALALSAPTATDGETLMVSATVANTGSRAGDEVVQVYVTEPAGKVAKPKQRLAGFARVPLAAGAQTTVQIPVEIARLRFWDETTHRFVAEPGTYTVRVGGSSVDQPLSGSFTVAP